MTKFDSNQYLKNHSFIAKYQGSVSICGDVITFSNLEFDETIKINSYNLVFNNNDIPITEIDNFNGTNEDGTTYKVNFNTLNYEFIGCIFNKNVYFNPSENINTTFDYCIFKEHFYVNENTKNEQKIDEIEIKNTTFEKDFVIIKTEIKSIKIKNVDFESLSEFNEVTFQKNFDLREITYKGFTLFDRCTFNTKAEFEYIIFEKFSSFRGTTFNKGLNLDFTSTDADKEINFFGIKGLENNESKQHTSQETYRIIKYNFEKIGNKLEANKYHALELDQKRRELEKNKGNNIKDYLVFKLHSWSSEHSTNWSLALLWILTVGFFTVFLLHLDIAIDLFFHPNNFKIEYIGKIWNQFFKFIYIGNMDDELKNNPFIFLFNKVLLGYLYYQFLTAVRKDTRK